MTMKSTVYHLDTLTTSGKIEQLREKIENTDAIVIGAGAGLSTSAGFTYSGDRFKQYFSDFIEKYHFRNMYEGGFYPFDSLEEHWAYWSRYIFINRYMDAPKPVYENLFELVKEKDYFVLTTNVDHCFQKAGFAKERLFYTQGDYGLFQCQIPCKPYTYENEALVKCMVEEQKDMCIPTELIPKCPICGKPMTMNLRADATFVQDTGWDIHAGYYEKFLNTHKKSKILFLELGVGYNTPGIIKYPFWQMTARNRNAEYICINKGEASVPKEIRARSIEVDADIYSVIKGLIKE
ncbi:MAG: Sir2 silent information regulator family NAD-dependent deacetylase [Lachnospiraceae bacterium]|nr:Sir2 silent information regulator family NAD-dependent deacetylase [Lachnospiraceae bacterium]